MSGTVWVIKTDYPYLATAVEAAGVDPNALVPEPVQMGEDRESRARLAYPSFFCDEPGTWLGVLASLVLRGVPVELWIEQDMAGQGLGMARIYPKFDSTMQTLLRSLLPGTMEDLDDLGDRVEQAMAHLRASEITGDFDGRR